MCSAKTAQRCIWVSSWLGAGVWLLARCADLQGLGYSIGSFWACVGALAAGGLAARAAAVAAMFGLHRDRMC